MQLLVDSSFLYALYNQDDHHHFEVTVVAEIYAGQFIIPDVVLTEVTFLFRRFGGVPATIQFLKTLVRGQYQYELVLEEDIIRVYEIMEHYLDAKLDFVDCCLMALAERLEITHICTLDRRDFMLFRPRHCDYLEILP